MTEPGYRPYEPQLTPIPVAEGVWTVDGPEVGYPIAGTVLPCPTRMTVVRLDGSALWLHSPVRYSSMVAERIARLGEVRFIVAPNTHHHLHTADWSAAFPSARLYATRDLAARPGPPFDRATVLCDGPPQEWSSVIDMVIVDLGSFMEAVFLHRPSRTLIVTDLIQSFEADRIRGRFARSLLRLGGATGPHGGPSIEIRMAALGRRVGARAARDTILGWRPERVILAHGRCFEADASREVMRAFGWAGRRSPPRLAWSTIQA